MEKKILLFMTLSLAASSAAAADMHITTGNMLKLRRMSTSESVAIEAYPRGEAVEIIDRSANGKWYKVRIPSDGKTGFMFAKYISRKMDPIEQFEGDAKNRSQGSRTSDPIVQQEACGQNEADGKIVSLISPGGQVDAGLQEKYDNAVKELTTVKVELKALKETMAGMQKEIAKRNTEINTLKEKIALYDGIDDIRLMSNVEAMGEEVLFSGIGLVKMFQEADRVVIRIPKEHMTIAHKIFSKVEKHIFGGGDHLYVTIDKKALNIV